MAECPSYSSPPPWKEAERLAALRKLAILDTDPEAEFDQLVALAAQVFCTPIAFISFLDEHRQWFKARHGLEITEMPREKSLCNLALLEPGVLVVPDIGATPLIEHRPVVGGAGELSFYAGVALRTKNGLPLGTLCVLDHKARPGGLSDHQKEALTALAGTVMRHLELKLAGRSAPVWEQLTPQRLANSVDCIMVLDGDRRLRFVSRGGLQALAEADMDLLLGKDWSHIWEKDTVDDATRAVVEAETSGFGRFQARRETSSDSPRWWDIVVTPILTRHGTCEGFLCIGRDITEYRQAEESLRRSEKRLRTLLNVMPLSVTSPQVVWFSDPDGEFSYCNEFWYEYTGLKPHAGSAGWLTVTHPHHRERILELWKGFLARAVPFEMEMPLRRDSDGAYRWFLVRGQPLVNDRGRVEHWFGIAVDIHERKQSEQALSESEERLQRALKAAHMIAWEFNPRTGVTMRSENALTLLGIKPGTDKAFMTGVHPDDRLKVADFLKRIQVSGSDTVEYRYVVPTGEIRWLRARAEQAGDDRVVGVTFDISEQKEAEKEIWRSANHDALTGLPNRNLFQHRLDDALSKARQSGTSVSLLLIDLDDFKDINDTLGHDAGDALLQETARRLSIMIRDCDTVARIGGDEFALLVVEPLKLENATRLGDLIAEQLRQPFVYQKRTLICRVSIGVAAFPDHDGLPAELVKDADIAMYQAKSLGRNRVVTYSPDMREVIEQRVSLGREMRDAIANDRIVPFYQPKISLSTGQIIGLEALARWHHPTGTLTPSAFSSVFEDHELASAIGRLLTAKIAADARQWLDQDLTFGRIALNVSPAEFAQAGLADNMLRTLDWLKVPPTLFEVEVTETVLLGRDSAKVSAALAKFNEHGIRIALDDFGTGYASLTHLKHFPVDHIKIDRSFIRDLEHDPDDEAIVTAVIGLGKSLQLQVTAEGVETHGQARRLRELGCDHAQGFLYAKPMAASRIPEMLRRWSAMLIHSQQERKQSR